MIPPLFYVVVGIFAAVSIFLIHRIARKQTTMTTSLETLTAQVAASTTVMGSALTLIAGFSAELAAAKGDPAKLDALDASLKASTDALAAAVLANTPAAPPAEVPAAAPTTPAAP